MLAVPLHEEDVAPRFCSADRFIIAELRGGQVCRVRRLTFPEEEWSARLEHLAATGVQVLLCGGFNRRFLPLAEGLGIQVIPGLAGKAEQLIEAFVRDEIERYRFVPCGRGRRHGRGWPRPGDAGTRRRDRELCNAGRRSNRPDRDWAERGTRTAVSGLAERGRDETEESEAGE